MAGFTALDVADEAQLGVARRRRCMRPASSPLDADGERAVDVDGRHDRRVDLAAQHHAGDVDGLGVGDPQAVAELRHLAQAAHEVADLRAAAVHDDGPHADGAHEHDVLARTAARASSLAASARALPPYFTTTVLPAKRRM